MEVTREDLYKIIVPQQTDTYVPVPNKVLLDKVVQIAGDYGYERKNETFNIAKAGDVMTGVITFNGYDPEMRMSIGVRNSYDKTKTLAIACGATVIICTNGMLRADLVEVRKHTGSVFEDLDFIIEKQVLLMKDEYSHLVDFKFRSKDIKISRTEVSHIVGEMFYEENLLKVTQLSIIKKEMSNSTFGVMGEKVSMWNFYNWVTESLKKEHPSDFLQSHIDFHKYFENKLLQYV